MTDRAGMPRKASTTEGSFLSSPCPSGGRAPIQETLVCGLANHAGKRGHLRYLEAIQ